MALGLAKYAATISLAGGAIYWSVQQGIWGTTKEGSDAGKKLTKVIAPTTSEYIEKIPSSKDVNTFVRTDWNTGVKTLFTAASQLPEIAGEYTEKAKTALSDKSGNWNHAVALDPHPPEKDSKATGETSDEKKSGDITSISDTENSNGAKSEFRKETAQNLDKQKSGQGISESHKERSKEVESKRSQSNLINKAKLNEVKHESTKKTKNSLKGKRQSNKNKPKSNRFEKDTKNQLLLKSPISESVRAAENTPSLKLPASAAISDAEKAENHVLQARNVETIASIISKKSSSGGLGCSMGMLCPMKPTVIVPTNVANTFPGKDKKVYLATSPPKINRQKIFEDEYLESKKKFSTLSQCSNRQVLILEMSPVNTSQVAPPGSACFLYEDRSEMDVDFFCPDFEEDIIAGQPEFAAGCSELSGGVSDNQPVMQECSEVPANLSAAAELMHASDPICIGSTVDQVVCQGGLSIGCGEETTGISMQESASKVVSPTQLACIGSTEASDGYSYFEQGCVDQPARDTDVTSPGSYETYHAPIDDQQRTPELARQTASPGEIQQSSGHVFGNEPEETCASQDQPPTIEPPLSPPQPPGVNLETADSTATHTSNIAEEDKEYSTGVSRIDIESAGGHKERSMSPSIYAAGEVSESPTTYTREGSKSATSYTGERSKSPTSYTAGEIFKSFASYIVGDGSESPASYTNEEGSKFLSCTVGEGSKSPTSYTAGENSKSLTSYIVEERPESPTPYTAGEGLTSTPYTAGENFKSATSYTAGERSNSPTSYTAGENLKSPSDTVGERSNSPKFYAVGESPTSHITEKEPTTPASYIADEKPTSPTSSIAEKPTSQASCIAENPSSPASYVADEKPTYPASYIGDEKPTSPASYIADKPTSPASYIANEKPTSPASYLVGKKPTSPAYYIADEKPTSPASSIADEKPTSPAYYISKKIPTSLTSYFFGERSKTSSSNAEERPKSPSSSILGERSKPPSFSTTGKRPKSQSPIAGAKPKLPSSSIAGERPKSPFSNAGKRPKSPSSYIAEERPKPPSFFTAGKRPKSQSSIAGAKPKFPSSIAGERPKSPFSNAGERLKSPSSYIAEEGPKSPPFSIAGERTKPPSFSTAGKRPKSQFSVAGARPKLPSSSIAGERPKSPFSKAGKRPKSPSYIAEERLKPSSFSTAGKRTKPPSSTAGESPKSRSSIVGARPKPPSSCIAGERHKSPFSVAGDRSKSPSSIAVDIPKSPSSIAGERPKSPSSCIAEERPASSASCIDDERPASSASCIDDERPASSTSCIDDERPASSASCIDDERPTSPASCAAGERPKSPFSVAGDIPKSPSSIAGDISKSPSSCIATENSSPTGTYITEDKAKSQMETSSVNVETMKTLMQSPDTKEQPISPKSRAPNITGESSTTGSLNDKDTTSSLEPSSINTESMDNLSKATDGKEKLPTPPDSSITRENPSPKETLNIVDDKPSSHKETPSFSESSDGEEQLIPATQSACLPKSYISCKTDARDKAPIINIDKINRTSEQIFLTQAARDKLISSAQISNTGHGGTSGIDRLSGSEIEAKSSVDKTESSNMLSAVCEKKADSIILKPTPIGLSANKMQSVAQDRPKAKEQWLNSKMKGPNKENKREAVESLLGPTFLKPTEIFRGWPGVVSPKAGQTARAAAKPWSAEHVIDAYPTDVNYLKYETKPAKAQTMNEEFLKVRHAQVPDFSVKYARSGDKHKVKRSHRGRPHASKRMSEKSPQQVYW